MDIDATDRRIINALQSGFPITSRPFASVAEELGLPEDDLIARLSALKKRGVITRFGPFLDAAAMGGRFASARWKSPKSNSMR